MRSSIALMLAVGLGIATGSYAEPEVCALRNGHTYHTCGCDVVKKDSRTQRIGLAEAAERRLDRHAKCGAPQIPPHLLPPPTAAPTPKPFKQCVAASLSQYAAVKSDDLLGAPEKGASGDKRSSSIVHIDGLGNVRDVVGGFVRFRKGEIVVVTEVFDEVIKLSSLLKHNVTRGRGAFEHQSAEHLNVTLFFQDLEHFDCATIKRALDQFFEPVDPAAATKLLTENPSGVLVDEVSAGMAPADVESILGPPERKATLGSKIIYFYPRLKVVFVDGRVTDIE